MLLGLGDMAGTSVQYELMTTREWQHNFYARDRWQISNKLTLDLGLRYEYYPIMTRADRGIEKVLGADDVNSTRNLAAHPELLTPDPTDGNALRPTVLLGGLGGSAEGRRDHGQQDAVRPAPRRRLPHRRE